jgi:hypothetical protein
MVDKTGDFLAGIRTGTFRIRRRIAKRPYATFRQKYTWRFTLTPLFHGTAAQLHALQYLTLDSSVRSCWGDGLPFLLLAFSELAALQTQRFESNADRAQGVPVIAARTCRSGKWVIMSTAARYSCFRMTVTQFVFVVDGRGLKGPVHSKLNCAV